MSAKWLMVYPRVAESAGPSDPVTNGLVVSLVCGGGLHAIVRETLRASKAIDFRDNMLG